MTQAEWMQEMGAAADDLGYGILSMEPRRVYLVRLDHPDIKVEIESRFLNGQLLRDTLRAQGTTPE